MKVIYCILFFSYSLLGLAGDQARYEGVIVLKSGKVLIGQVSITSHRLAVYYVEREIMVYPSHKISEIRFYDCANDVNRRYLSIDKSEGESILYEVVVSGPITVLRTPKRIFEETSLLDHFDFDYFIRWQNDVFAIKKFQKEILPELPDMESIKSYVKRERLNPFGVADLIKIAQFYNQSARQEKYLVGL